MHKITSLNYLPWLLILLPLTALLMTWDRLPRQVPIPAAGGGPDRWASKDDNYYGDLRNEDAILLQQLANR